MSRSQPSPANAKDPHPLPEGEGIKYINTPSPLGRGGAQLCSTGVRALIILSLLTSPASASFISLKTALSSYYANGRLTAKVVIINKGDEPAHDLRAEFKVGGQDVLSENLPELPVGGTARIEKSIPFTPTLPGTYPLTLITHYTDANQYPFSGLMMQTFVCQRAGLPSLVSRLDPLSFDQQGELNLNLKNTGLSPITARTTLVAPVELTVENAVRKTELMPGADCGLNFTVKNFSALPGSVYQAWAVTEYDEDGFHYTSLAPAVVKLVAEQQLFGLNPRWLAVLLVLLIIVFAAAQFRSRKNR